MFEIGENVIYMPNGQQATIVGRHNGLGGITYDISQNGTTYQNVDESDLQRCAMPNNPFEQMQQGYWGDNLDFCERNTTFKIKNSNSNTISTLLASRATFHAYQYKPLLKFFQSDNNRLLVADEVGLGKTIEAGHIMNELKARNRFGNVLIICPKSLCENWKNEMKKFFNFAFDWIDDSTELAKYLSAHRGSARIVTNYDRLRNPIIQKELKEYNKFDLVVCDEAHRLKNDQTDTYKIVKEIFSPEKTKSMLFLTATPIMLREEDLFNLLHLLDPEKYDNETIFYNELENNKPFIKALTQISKEDKDTKELIYSLKTIADELTSQSVNIYKKIDNNRYESYGTKKLDELYANISLYQKIKNTLQNAEDSAKIRAELLFDINSLSRLNHIFSRSRKKDVLKDDVSKRTAIDEIITLESQEREFFDKITNNYETKNGDTLGLIQIKRMVSSSVYGYMVHKQHAQTTRFVNLPDAKYTRLKLLAQNNEKIIVFVEFKATSRYIAERLKNDNVSAVIIDGDTPADERNSLAMQFRDNPSIKILLATNVMSQGVNLQFCNRIVNYDLPWNPMVVEQRIGRIDRIGQKAKEIFIHNFIVKDTIVERIYKSLLWKIGVFKDNIGDLDAILGEDTRIYKEIEALEREVYTKNLSENEITKKIESIAIAAENEQIALRNLVENSELLLTNDVYFSEEIKRIKSNHRYVTEHELKMYVEQLLNINNPLYQLSALGGLQEIDSKKMKFSICFPHGTGRLRNFISDFVPSTNELGVLRDQYNNYLRDKNQIIFTFSQAEAAENTHKRNSQWEYINVYHPLIVAAQNYFEQHNPQGIKKAFKIELAENREKNITRGEYILAVYTTKFTKHLSNNQTQSNEILTPIVFDMQQNAILNSEQSEQFLGEAQLSATKNHFFTEISHELLQRLPFYFSSEIREQNNAYFEEHKMRLESEVELLVKRKTEFYDQRIATQEQVVINSEQNLAELEYRQECGEIYREFDHKVQKFKYLDELIKNQRSILPAQRGTLEALRAEKEREIDRIRDICFTHDPANILSVTHITVK